MTISSPPRISKKRPGESRFSLSSHHDNNNNRNNNNNSSSSNSSNNNMDTTTNTMMPMGGPALPFPHPSTMGVDVVSSSSSSPQMISTTCMEDKNDPSQGAYRLASELELYTKDGLEAVRSQGIIMGQPYPIRVGESLADLQLKTARQLRQLLPTTTASSQQQNSITTTGGDLLHLVQERNWIPILLRWLNGPDRPAVQIEALLALTNIAELCATSYKYGSPQHHPTNVPFPPLSFSQTLSAEALAAFHASLSSTIQHHHHHHHQQQQQQQGSLSNNHSTTNHTNKSSLSAKSGPVPPPTVHTNTNKISFPQHLSASSQHLLLRHADAIPTIIHLLANDDRPMVYEQALWILGSLVANSGDNNDKARDIVLAKGIWTPLLRCLEKHRHSIQIQRLGSWCLSNLSENMLQQQQQSSSSSSCFSSSRGGTTTTTTGKEEDELLLLLQQWLQGSDPEILSYACWTLSHWCDGPSPQIAAVVNGKNHPSFVPRLVELLTHKVWRVTKPALRTIGNIVCAEGTDGDYTQVILEERAVPKLTQLISHSNREIQKEACWTLSNIAAGTVDQIQAVLEAGAIPPLVQLVSSEQDPEVRSEACWVVLNATSCGSDAQIDWLVQEGCVSVLGVLLEEVSMVMMALEGLERVLQVEEAHCRNNTNLLSSSLVTPSSGANSSSSSKNQHPQQLVPPSLMERACLDPKQSSAVTKRASRIWNQHFVSCALCQQSFSKHFSETNFCEECKCHVCLNCNCQIYHLSYQEELWAATEEQAAQGGAGGDHNNNGGGTKKKKKSRKAKKKEKKLQQKQQEEEAAQEQQQKEEEERQQQQEEEPTNSSTTTHKNETNHTTTPPSTSSSSSQQKNDTTIRRQKEKDSTTIKERHPPIDFVSYLQETNSIIALAKLMDALEYGDDDDDDETNHGNNNERTTTTATTTTNSSSSSNNVPHVCRGKAITIVPSKQK